MGGETLHQLVDSGANYTITCLVRGSKVASFSKAYPQVRVVEGDLDDEELLAREAGQADIVLSTRLRPPIRFTPCDISRIDRLFFSFQTSRV